jgi:hypothetical protein
MQIAFSKIIYLTGPISSEPDYKRVFATAHRLFAHDGHPVINPAEIVLEWADKMPEPECWAGYLTYDLAILNSISTNAIMVRLPNWGRSKGSCLEQAFALHHHIPVKNITDYFPDFQSMLNG